jgi:acetolactate synthase I/II/III large subunit
MPVAAARYSQTDLGTHKRSIPDFTPLAAALQCAGAALRVQRGRRHVIQRDQRRPGGPVERKRTVCGLGLPVW